MSNSNYNGWANYATWRVNLELFDSLEEDTVREYEGNLVGLMDYLEELAELAITGYGDRNEGIAVDYARAFIEEVDYHEIAAALLDTYNLKA